MRSSLRTGTHTHAHTSLYTSTCTIALNQCSSSTFQLTRHFIAVSVHHRWLASFSVPRSHVPSTTEIIWFGSIYSPELLAGKSTLNDSVWSRMAHILHCILFCFISWSLTHLKESLHGSILKLLPRRDIYILARSCSLWSMATFHTQAHIHTLSLPDCACKSACSHTHTHTERRVNLHKVFVRANHHQPPFVWQADSVNYARGRSLGSCIPLSYVCVQLCLQLGSTIMIERAV